MANPLGWSSPMGGGAGGGGAAGGKKAWTALVTELNKAVSASKSIRDNMEAAAKAAASIAKGSGGLLGQGTAATGSTGNGGGASMPTPPGRSAHWINQHQPGSPFPLVGARPAGFGGGMGAQLPLGGGATMPAAPGVRTYEQTMAASQQIAADAQTKSNGGGFNIPAFAKKALGGVAGATAVSMANLDNARSMDWLANRSARVANGGYNKTTAGDALMGQFANSFRTHAEREAAIMPLLNRGGFASNSAGFGTMASSVRSMAALNPMMGGAQAANAQLGFQSPEAINMSRVAFGFSTVGAGGRPKSVAEISQQLMRSVAGGKLLSTNQLQGELGQTGMLRVNMQRAGFNEDMQQAIQDYLTESSKSGRYLSDSEIQRRRGPGADTIMGAEQETATSRAGVLNSYLEEYADAFAGMSDRINDALDMAAASIERIPGLAKAIGTAAGASAAVTNSGPVGRALGAATLGAGALGLRKLGRSGGRAGGAARGAARMGLRAIPFVGTAIGAGLAIKDADYSGNNWSDARNIGLNFATLGWLGDEQGDGYGGRRGKQIHVGGSGWSGISQPEMGDGKGHSKGRGGSTLEFLENLMKQSGLPHRITSRVRGNARTSSGNLSYHATGHAIDIAGPTPGIDTEDMLKINHYLARKLGQGAQELIYSGPGAVNLHGGKKHSYGDRVRRMHHNHVHVAVTPESLKRIGIKVKDYEGSGPMSADAAERRGKRHNVEENKRALEQLNKAKGRRFRLGGGRFSESRLIRDILGNLRADRGRSPSDPDPTEAFAHSGESTTGVGAAGQSVGAHAIDKFLHGLRDKESGGDYQADNPNSTAAGAYQYLTGTWANYKGYKTADQAPPHIQDERARMDAARLYGRYGNWRHVAAAHFRGEGFVRKNPDPSSWTGKTPGKGNPGTLDYVKDVLQRAGLPETGDGHGHSELSGAPTTTVSTPEMGDGYGGSSTGGHRTTVNARSSGGIHISKVEVHITTPQVSEAEARRIGKMVAGQIAEQTRMKEMSR